jgi:hypothetical protein
VAVVFLFFFFRVSVFGLAVVPVKICREVKDGEIKTRRKGKSRVGRKETGGRRIRMGRRS